MRALIVAAALLVFTSCNNTRTYKQGREDGRPVFALSSCFTPKYAVVQCGVHNETQFLVAKENPVVRAHYANFVYGDVRIVPANTRKYSSYYRGGEIRWTDSKIAVAAGTRVVNDGSGSDLQLKQLCGNLLADTLPPGAVVETIPPTPQELEQSADVADLPAGTVETLPISTGDVLGDNYILPTLAELNQPLTSGIKPAGGEAEAAMAGFPGGGGGFGGGAGGGGAVVVVNNLCDCCLAAAGAGVVATPEPSLLVPFGFGLLGAWYILKQSRSNS